MSPFCRDVDAINRKQKISKTLNSIPPVWCPTTNHPFCPWTRTIPKSIRPMNQMQEIFRKNPNTTRRPNRISPSVTIHAKASPGWKPWLSRNSPKPGILKWISLIAPCATIINPTNTLNTKSQPEVEINGNRLIIFTWWSLPANLVRLWFQKTAFGQTVAWIGQTTDLSNRETCPLARFLTMNLTKAFN